MSQLASRAHGLAGRLIASTGSNRALMDFVAGYLDDHGIDAEIIPSPGDDRTNLPATVGPACAPGVNGSGHTYVVPADHAQVRIRGRFAECGLLLHQGSPEFTGEAIS